MQPLMSSSTKGATTLSCNHMHFLRVLIGLQLTSFIHICLSLFFKHLFHSCIHLFIHSLIHKVCLFIYFNPFIHLPFNHFHYFVRMFAAVIHLSNFVWKCICLWLWADVFFILFFNYSFWVYVTGTPCIQYHLTISTTA